MTTAASRSANNTRRLDRTVSARAERAVLGAVLADETVFHRIEDRLRSQDFECEEHRAAFEAMGALGDEEKPIDLVTVVDRLEVTGQLERAGGVQYMAALAEGLPDPANIEHYARLVREHADRRRLRAGMAAATELIDRGAVPGNFGTLKGLIEAVENAGTSGSLGEAAAGEFEEAVAREAFTVRVRAEARRRITAESGSREPFDAALLADVNEEAVHWRVRELLARHARLLLAAQRKGGKTTTTLNLARDLILGWDFLGRFPVDPIVGRVGFLNFEVAGSQLARWAREVGIPEDRFLLVNLRGRANPFADPDDTARLAELMRSYQVEVLIVDPFGRAYPGKSQNDAGEVGAWLSDLDRFVEAAGCSELILTAHAGWAGERTRGSSALEDWADAVAYIVRDEEDDKVRYFRALGRDVEVEEDSLNFDPVTRRLTLAGSGSRATARAHRRMEELVAGVVEAVTREPGATTGRLEELLRGMGLGLQRGDVGQAARAAADAGQIVRVPGPRNSLKHFLKGHEGESSRVVPTIPAGSTGVVPTPPYRGGTTAVLLGPPVVPGRLDPGQPDTDREPGSNDDLPLPGDDDGGVSL